MTHKNSKGGIKSSAKSELVCRSDLLQKSFHYMKIKECQVSPNRSLPALRMSQFVSLSVTLGRLLLCWRF